MPTIRHKVTVVALTAMLSSVGGLSGCSRSENSPAGGGASNETSAPANANAQTAAGDGAPDLKKYDAEITRLEREVEKSPGDDLARGTLAKAYLNRGNILADAKQFKAALADYRSALHLDPDNEDAQRKTAAMRKEIGDDAEDDDSGEPVGLPPSPDALDDAETDAPSRPNKKGNGNK